MTPAIATPEQVRRYLAGESAKDIARGGPVSANTVLEMLKRAGVKLRTRGQARLLGRARGKAWVSMAIAKASSERVPLDNLNKRKRAA